MEYLIIKKMRLTKIILYLILMLSCNKNVEVIKETFSDGSTKTSFIHLGDTILDGKKYNLTFETKYNIKGEIIETSKYLDNSPIGVKTIYENGEIKEKMQFIYVSDSRLLQLYNCDSTLFEVVQSSLTYLNQHFFYSNNKLIKELSSFYSIKPSQDYSVDMASRIEFHEPKIAIKNLHLEFDINDGKKIHIIQCPGSSYSFKTPTNKKGTSNKVGFAIITGYRIPISIDSIYSSRVVFFDSKWEMW